MRTVAGCRVPDAGWLHLASCILYLVSCILHLASLSPAEAGVLTVGPGERIGTAIKQAQDGDTILINPGTYNEDLLLDRRITLEGSGEAIIRGSGNKSVVTVTAEGCTLRGLIIEHSGGDLQAEDSGVLLKSDHNRIEDNQLRDILYGIYLYRSAGNVIARNTITGRKEIESGERGAGLHLWDSPDNVLEDNVISWARDGLYIQSSDGNRIRGNRVSNLRYGIHYMFSNRNVFEDNWFVNNVAGGAIMYSRNIEFRRNRFLHNRGFSSFGILFQDCDACLAEENAIVDNQVGIFMEALHDSTFRRNQIAENDVALQMFSSASDNIFTLNNFIENLSPLRLIGAATTTRWQLKGRGNYWSDYDGYDLDGDGIGDIRHRIVNLFDYVEGNRPRIRLYLYSPAAQCLAVADKLFPAVQMSRENDPSPLMRPVRIDAAAPAQSAAHAPVILLSIAMLGSALAVLWRNRS